MIMAAPLPSGVLQNEHIFLPLTDLFRGRARGSGTGSGVAADGDQDCPRELMDWDDGRVADPERPLWYDEEPESDEWGRL